MQMYILLVPNKNKKVKRVKIYVKKVFLLVFNFFKNLSKNFIIYSPFLYFNSTYILSYKMAKKTSIFGKKVGKQGDE